MLSTGEAKKVFQDQVCPMMTAKTKEEFTKARHSLNEKCLNHIKTSKAVLKLRVDVDFVPDPRKCTGTPGQKLPAVREILARENSSI